ncbi:piwi-like Twi9p protein (macronuclear) [Tetrahymena thermophila SB210]|uniref:Piwi-like Twi9p protein n=2 Tax=Tetrahymena thermophila TaxID=5911 RepID=I7MCS7_TETTS|nr:piwi-like Twi9p protein [Tetrahymena thermophila SB210]ABP68416.1 Twi7p [Tetrahymena thermophila]EAR84853.1 piwi-like Twi9p protein [Tetrahymena thermophila SB210]|eukprot:XP_001032516.1 piwi-like Twi9p protein [Tetrahymena thermophila SB210]
MITQLPKRPNKSSSSTIAKISNNIRLLTNMFSMSIHDPENSDSEDNQVNDRNLMCYQYDVKFDPSIAEDNSNLRQKIFKQARLSIQKIIGRFSFSGKSLYSLKRLDQNALDSVSLESVRVDDQTYSLSLTFTKLFEVNEESAQNKDKTTPNYKKGNKVTQVLNVILKNIIDQEGFKQIGRNSQFFDLQSRADVVIKNQNNTSTLEVYKGITFKVSPTQQGLYLNSDYLCRILRKETAQQYLTARHDIEGQSVLTKYNNYRTYIIDRVDYSKNPRSTFLYRKTNLQISYAEYYFQNYQIEIRDMQQPLLVSKIKYREADTNILKIQEIFLIPELCYMTGLTDEQRKNKNAMKEIATHTKLTPEQKYSKSVQYCQLFGRKTIKSGIRISHTDNKIDAIQLKAPKITFGGKSFIPEHGGNFETRAPTQDQVQFKDWAIIHHKNDEKEVYKFIDLLKNASQAYQINVNDKPQFFAPEDFNPKNWIRLLDKDFRKNGVPQFIVTFSNAEKNPSLYREMKKFFSSEGGVGIESQHVTPRALQKNGKSVASKIALQIASKLGKRIWSVETPVGINQNTMIVGIETSMKKIRNQQVIGVVASINKDFNKFYSQVDFRNGNDIKLPTLSKIISSAIEAYSKNTKTVPEEIIIYRQGLGEGQIQYSHQLEIQAIQNGFINFKQGYSPRFAFFQVNRKISEKFYQQLYNERVQISNPPSGTIVASELTQNNFEFFMAAQNCNSGVCTPTKYTCLFNNTNLKEDQFWQLTYFQTFNYYNWQGPIRVPAVMKYAEKLAKFTSETLEGVANNELINSLYYI